MKKIWVSMMIAGGLISPAAYATNGYFSHGYGMKAKGMGGVGIALPQDALAAATNPAGMVLVGSRIDFGVDWFKPNRSAQITGAGAPGANGTYDGNNTSNFLIPEFGYNKMMDENYSLGVSVYGNGGMNTDYANNPFKAYGGVGNGGVNLEQLFVAPTWSKKINANNAVGISLNLAYQRFSAQGIQGFSAATAPGIGANSTSNNGTDTSTGYGLHFGWIGQVSPDVSLGASYQTKTKMGKFGKYSGLFAEQGGFDIPATYGVGIAVKASPVTTVAFDIQRILYGSVNSIANPLGTPPFNLGASNGSGFGWQNMTVYKLGISHNWSDKLTLRAGYNHNNQQIPSSETFFNILAPGVELDHLTLGATWKLEDKSEITFAYMHAFKKTINGTANSIPTAYGGGSANLTMYEDSIGIAYGWNM